MDKSYLIWPQAARCGAHRGSGHFRSPSHLSGCPWLENMRQASRCAS